MSAPLFRFEQIAPHHHVATFRSDNTAIDTFLWNDALRENEEELSRTYLLIDAVADPADAVAGFFTLRADAQWTTGLPNEEEMRYLPVAELAYLARHKRFRGQQIGDVLLLQLFRVVADAADRIGISGIYLTATNEGVTLYQRYGFVLYEGGNKRMFLPIRIVRAVVEAMDAA